MNLHDLIYNVIKNLGYFTLLFILSLITLSITKRFMPLEVAAFILLPIYIIGVVCIGYKNTINLTSKKFKNSFILHVVISMFFCTLSLMFSYKFSDGIMLDSFILSITLIMILESGSLIYFFKNRKINS